MVVAMSLGADAEAALIALITEHHEQADQALERPLADWSQWLDSEGYGANDLDAFFLNPDLLQHWQGETALTDLYGKAIAAGQSTGEFIETLSEREPAYLEQTVEAADLLLAKSAELMATAGGTGHRTNLSTGAKIGISAAALSVGGVAGVLLVRKLRKSDAVNPDSLAKDAAQAGEKNLEHQANDVFGGKDKMQDTKIVAKEDLKIQEKKFGEATEELKSGGKNELNDIERRDGIFKDQIKLIQDKNLEKITNFKAVKQKALDDQKMELDNFLKNSDSFDKWVYKNEFLSNEKFAHDYIAVSAESRRDYQVRFERYTFWRNTQCKTLGISFEDYDKMNVDDLIELYKNVPLEAFEVVEDPDIAGEIISPEKVRSNNIFILKELGKTSKPNIYNIITENIKSGDNGMLNHLRTFNEAKKSELEKKFDNEVDKYEAEAENALDAEIKEIEAMMAKDAEAKATREVEEVFGVQIEGDLSTLESKAIDDAEQKASNEAEDLLIDTEDKAGDFGEDFFE